MRVLIATDAWHPQVNGVVRTLTSLAASARSLGVAIEFLTPEGFPSIPVPTYRGLRLALPSRREIARRIERAAPDAIHIATEGPIGHTARAYCLQRRAAVHHQLHDPLSRIHRGALADPASLELRGAAPLPCGRGRHDGVHAVADDRARARAASSNLGMWTRGVDTELFAPERAIDLDLPRPIFVSVGPRSRSRRTSRRFSRSTCPAPRWSSATARRKPELRRALPGREVPRPAGRARARRRIWPPPTCSCSRARPTPSASCSSRRSPAAFRSRPIR